MHISVVSPVYKAETIVDELVRQLIAVLPQLTDDYEILLVEDHSPDRSWQKITENCTRNPKVKGIKLSRNFGQHHAITAGLDAAKGDWVIVMDCDLQDSPHEIPALYKKALEGYDIVYARRAIRQDGFLKKWSSRFYIKLFNWLSGAKLDPAIANFGIYNRKVIKAVNSMREPMRAFVPMVQWTGFNSTAIDVTHQSRYEGKTSYNWSKLINLAMDIAVSFSDKPLRLTVNLGLMISGAAILFAIYNVIKYTLGIIQQPGFTSLILSIWLLSGLIIFSLGIVGFYISKVFEGVKQRPLYIVDEHINLDK